MTDMRQHIERSYVFLPFLFFQENFVCGVKALCRAQSARQARDLFFQLRRVGTLIRHL